MPKLLATSIVKQFSYCVSIRDNNLPPFMFQDLFLKKILRPFHRFISYLNILLISSSGDKAPSLTLEITLNLLSLRPTFLA